MDFAAHRIQHELAKCIYCELSVYDWDPNVVKVGDWLAHTDCDQDAQWDEFLSANAIAVQVGEMP